MPHIACPKDSELYMSKQRRLISHLSLRQGQRNISLVACWKWSFTLSYGQSVPLHFSPLHHQQGSLEEKTAILKSYFLQNNLVIIKSLYSSLFSSWSHLITQSSWLYSGKWLICCQSLFIFTCIVMYFGSF